MFLLSLIATYQVWTVSLKAGQSTYNRTGADRANGSPRFKFIVRGAAAHR